MNNYTQALLGASGITTGQAKTCLYYAQSTYLLPDKLEKVPILDITGPLGTGKSDLLKQLARMVKEPKIISGETTSTLRDELDGVVTALIDEGDKINEMLLINRYSKANSTITYKISKDRGWNTYTGNLFGATIICRRLPFENSAAKSRSITIRTRYNPGKYEVIDTDKKFLEDIVKMVNISMKVSQRVADNWLPLRAIAMASGDEEWLKYSDEEIRKDTLSLLAGQGYEPEEAVLITLKAKVISPPRDTLISELKTSLKNEFDLNLKNYQIRQILTDMGFKIVTGGNYPMVKSDEKLLDKLMTERNLKGV